MLRDLSHSMKKSFMTSESVFIIIIAHFEENVLCIGSMRAQMRDYKHFKIVNPQFSFIIYNT